jgi:hypothetical protein
MQAEPPRSIVAAFRKSMEPVPGVDLTEPVEEWDAAKRLKPSCSPPAVTG